MDRWFVRAPLTSAADLHTLTLVKTEEQLDAESGHLATKITEYINAWMEQNPSEDPDDEIVLETLISVACGIAFGRYGWSVDEILSMVSDIANEMQDEISDAGAEPIVPT